MKTTGLLSRAALPVLGLAAALALVFLVPAQPAAAHHAFSAEFDATKPVRPARPGDEGRVGEPACLDSHRRHRRERHRDGVDGRVRPAGRPGSSRLEEELGCPGDRGSRRGLPGNRRRSAGEWPRCHPARWAAAVRGLVPAPARRTTIASPPGSPRASGLRPLWLRVVRRRNLPAILLVVTLIDEQGNVAGVFDTGGRSVQAPSLGGVSANGRRAASDLRAGACIPGDLQ